MNRETAKRLHDAKTACEEAEFMCSDMTREAFLLDRRSQLAVQKLIENLGEALRQAEESDRELVQKLPNLRRVVNTRNRLVHGYDTVDFGAIWDIVERRIPELRNDLTEMLNLYPVSSFGRDPNESP